MFIMSHDILGCIDTFPDRCSNDAHICYSNPAMRRSCPKTCGDCGEGILSLKIYMKPNRLIKMLQLANIYLRNKMSIVECGSDGDCLANDKPFCTNGFCTGIT